MQVRSATEADAGPISSLIHGLSAPFLLSPDGKGAELFLESIGELAIRGYVSAGNGGRFTVNSSLNAVSFYERLGFAPVGPKVVKHGVAFVPMQLVVGENGGQPLHRADV